MGFSLPALWTLFQKRLAKHKVLFCLPVVALIGCYGLAVVQNHELDLAILGVNPEAPNEVIAQQQFFVRSHNHSNAPKHPPMIAVTRWLSSEETQQAVLHAWQKQTHQKTAPPFHLSFYPVEEKGHLPAIVCQVQMKNSSKGSHSGKPSLNPVVVASDLSHLACEQARKTYQKLFSTPPDFNQEYAFHRLHAIESSLSQTLVALSKLEGTTRQGPLQTFQQLENSIFYRTMVSVNQDQHQLLRQRYQSILGQVQKELPLNHKTIQAMDQKAIGSLLAQNQAILSLEKALRHDQAEWQSAQKTWGLADAKTQKLADKLNRTQTQLQNALKASPVLAARQKQQGLPDDPENWIPVALNQPPHHQIETPAVQLEGSLKPFKIHYRPLSQREIAMLEDLRHLSGSISLASQRQNRAKQAHRQASHSVRQALQDSEMQNQRLEALQEKKAFLEQSYTLWSEMASRQAILKAWQQENSTSGLSPVIVKISANNKISSNKMSANIKTSYGKESPWFGKPLAQGLETLPVLDWDLLSQPFIMFGLLLFSLFAGTGLVMIQKDPLLASNIQTEKPQTETRQKEKHQPDQAPLDQTALDPKKPLDKKKGFQPAQRSLSAGEALGKTQENKIGQWLGHSLSTNSISEQKPNDSKTILTLNIANVDVEAPHLFLATLQDPDSLVSHGIRKAIEDLKGLDVVFKTVMVSGNSLLASGLAIELSRTQKTSLLELTQESGLLGYLFQMGEGQMKGCEGLSDLFLEHYTAEVLLKLIANQSGVSGLTVLPHHGETLSPFNKQLNGLKKLWPLLQTQSEKRVIAAPSLKTYPDWSRAAELVQPDVIFIESEAQGGFDLKKLQKSLPQTQLILLQ
jgi:hypothetical protein